ncbi:MAG: hypothetical protein O7G31_13730, partial [Calditrichaeota bacterium]|nr:hypothetical protein [Calditrichota bacterium]
DAGPASQPRNMSFWIGNALAIDQVSRQDWEQFAIECGFTAAFIRRKVRSLAEAVNDALPQVIGSVLEEHPLAVRAAKAVQAGVTQQINMILN